MFIFPKLSTAISTGSRCCGEFIDGLLYVYVHIVCGVFVRDDTSCDK